MKQNRLLNGILASSLVLSMAVPALAVTVEEAPVLQQQSTQTLASSESDFTLEDGTITKYKGSDANVVIPVTIGGKEVYAIGNEAFRSNQNLRSVSFASGSLVTEIKGGTSSYYKTGAFSGCGNLATVTLPNSMVVMGAYAFSNCNSLTTVTGGTSLKTIGAGAFYNNIALSHMELLDKVTSINSDTYSGCSDLVIYCNNKSYALDYALNLGYKYVRMNASEAEKAVDAMNYDWKFSEGTITKYTGSDSTVVVPATLGGYEVYTISNEAFRDNATLRTVSFAAGSLVTEIKGGTSSYYKTGTFSGCRNLVSVVLPDSLLNLGAYAFSNCITLNSVTGGRNLKSIGTGSYNGCISLSTVEIYDKVTTINALTGLDDLVIYGYSDTPAEEYALKNGIPFRILTASSQPTVTTPTTTPTTPTTTTPDSSTDTSRPSSGSADINVYVDVSNTSWYYTYVELVVNTNIMTGYGNSFMPETMATRGSIAQSLANMSREDVPSIAASSFSDVTGTGFESYVAWCSSNGLMSGIGDGQFGVNNNVTREQFALILKQFATYKGNNTSISANAVNSLSAFSDSGSVSSWAVEGIAWAVENGLMSGSDGLLNPTGNISRAQVATMLYTYGMTFG